MNYLEEKLGINFKEEIKKCINVAELSTIEFERFSLEYDKLSEYNACILYLCKLVSEFAKINNELILYRGLIYNSYIAYLLGITTINPMDKEYFLYPELAFGLDGKLPLAMQINVSKSFKNVLIGYLRAILNGNFYLYEKRSYRYLILLEEKLDLVYEKNGFHYLMEEKNNYLDDDKVLIVDISYLRQLDGLNELIRKNGYPKEDIYNDKEIEKLFSLNLNAGLPSGGAPTYRKNVDYSSYISLIAAWHGSNTYNQIYDISKTDCNYFKEYPTSRDMLMTYLINSGIDRKLSYEITRFVRLGRSMREEQKETWDSYYSILKKHIDEKILDYLTGIEYMFFLGLSIAFCQIDYLTQYYKVKDPEFYKIMCGDIKKYYSHQNIIVDGDLTIDGNLIEDYDEYCYALVSEEHRRNEEYFLSDSIESFDEVDDSPF